MHFVRWKCINFDWASLNFVPKGPMNNIPALVQIMAWRRPGDKPLSEPMIVSLLTHVWVTRPEWVNLCLTSYWLNLLRGTPYNTASRAFPASVRNKAPPFRVLSRSLKSSQISNSFFHSAYAKSSIMSGGCFDDAMMIMKLPKRVVSCYV